MLANPSRIFLTLAVALVGVSSQSLDSCIVTCLSNAAQAPGSCTNMCRNPHWSHFSLSDSASFNSQDLSCVCNNTVFKTAAANCLTANCTAQDQQTALQLEQSQCGNSMRLLPTFFPTRASDTSLISCHVLQHRKCYLTHRQIQEWCYPHWAVAIFHRWRRHWGSRPGCHCFVTRLYHTPSIIQTLS
jgi:hypothetical protein